MNPEQNTKQSPAPASPTNTSAFNTNDSADKSMPKNILLTLAALVVILGIVLAVSFFSKSRTPEFTKDNVTVNRADMTSLNMRERLPAGFPEDIPVNTDTLVESLSMNYEDTGVVLHSVSFMTDGTSAETFAEYFSYMNNAGYQISTEGTSPERGTIYGTMDGNELGIILSPRDTGALVQISYLDR